MCNYKYQYRKHQLTGLPCIYPAFYEEHEALFPETKLLIDTDGYCIFHSTNKDWKIQNGFIEKFIELLKVIEELCKAKTPPKRKYNFSGFQFVNEKGPLKFTNFPDGSSPELTFCHFLNELIIEDCQVNSIDIGNALFYEMFTIKNVNFNSGINGTEATFNNGITISNCLLEGYNYFDNCTFKNVAGKVSNNFRFRDSTAEYLNFENSTFESSVTFAKMVFKAEVTFDKTKFLGEFYFHDNEMNEVISFKETSFQLTENANPRYKSVDFQKLKITDNGKLIFRGSAPFENMVRGELQMSFEDDPQGLVSFENFNLNKISLHTKLKLFELEKMGKVEIGLGCRKYYCQTDILTIEASNSGQKLILDLTNVFCNYFETQQGYNLGIEIIERSRSYIKYFYFTDEIISKDDFTEKIRHNESDLWETFSNLTKHSTAIVPKNDMGTKNCLIDLAGFFLKIGNQIEHNNLSKEDFGNIFNSVSLDGKSIIDTKTLLTEIEMKWGNFNKTVPTIIIKNMGNQYINYGNVEQFGENNYKTIISENSSISDEEKNLIFEKIEEIKKELEPEKKQNKLTKFIKDFGPTIGEAAIKMISALVS